MRVYAILAAVLLVVFDFTSANASQVTIGNDGINSAGLLGLNGMPLTGAGIAIGQVEIGRPGRRVTNGGPDDNAHSDASIIPAGLFLGNTVDTVPNTHVDGHAQDVAGVMISTDATRTGVAPGAQLYSAARNPSTAVEEGHAQSSQQIATRNGGDVRAVNMSFGTALTGGAELDGNNLLTQFIDWSASHHDTLYVVAGNEGLTGGFPIPTDTYNGIVVGFSSRIGGVYRQVDPLNNFSEQPPGDRKVVSILAPGENVDMVRFNGASTPNNENDGTSFAAPHVTGAVALLQQYAEQKIAAHEVDPKNWAR
jgi:subtilisin family serine protease